MKHPEESLGRKHRLQIRSPSRQRLPRIPGAASQPAQLRSLARAYGIQTSYVDMTGVVQEAPLDTLKALLALWGVSADNPQRIRLAFQERRSCWWRRCLEPVIVSWDGRPTQIELRLPVSSATRHLTGKLLLEDGTTRTLSVDLARLRTIHGAEVDQQPFQAKRFTLPALPQGYHQVEIFSDEGIQRSLMVAAPVESYSPPGLRKDWGVFLPTYALHSEESWGAGNWSDWQRLSEGISGLGGGVVATLPLTATFLQPPLYEPSPYSPASRLFWNEFFLDVTRVPEFSRCAAAQRQAASPAFRRRLMRFRKSDFVDYAAEMAARRQVLEMLAQFFFGTANSERQAAFRSFLRARPEVEQYARFRAVCEQAGNSWHAWPARRRNGVLRNGDYAEPVKRYHLYVQWLAQEQMASLIECCREQGLKFCLDLPLGVHPDGFDIWREQDIFAIDANTGAPPDAFFTKGQDWGFVPLHPEKVRDQQYRYVLELLRFQMRHTDLLRIDHVMGLHRLYWIPKGFPANAGAYVRYPAEEWYAMLSLESHRHQTMLLGENLGTVPREVNSSMRRHRLRGMYVLQYEQRPDPKQPVRTPSVHTVASINTHDMPMFAAHWRGLDIKDRAALGLIKRGELIKERLRRRKLNGALVRFLRRKGFLKISKPSALAVLRASLEFLSASRAEIVLANLEDLWAETRSQNVPGTRTERPNWTRKSRLTLERILGKPELREAFRRMDNLRRKRSYNS